MLEISIQGKKDGVYPYSLEADVSLVAGMPSNFFGVIRVEGSWKRHRDQIIVEGSASVGASFVCDRSAEEYEEDVVAQLSVVYIVDTERWLEQRRETEPDPPYYLPEDAQVIDLTEEIRQQLILSIPVRTIAPKYREVDLEQLYPDVVEGAVGSSVGGEKEIVDERWAALKKLKFDPPSNGS